MVCFRQRRNDKLSIADTGSLVAHDTYCCTERHKLPHDHAPSAQTEGYKVSSVIGLRTQTDIFSNALACKALDDLIERRLFREENSAWIEKATITRIWIATTSDNATTDVDDLQALFDSILQNTKAPLPAPATHAAQTVQGLICLR